MKHPLDIFQKIYVINLASRQDRRREMCDQLSRIGLSPEAGKAEFFDAVRPEVAGDFPSIGSRGCFLSHLGVLKDASARGFQTVLILEDDLNFVDTFRQRMAAIGERLRERDWSIFYGGYRVDRTPAPDGLDCAAISSDEGVGTTHFVGVQGEVIPSLVRYLEAQLARPRGHPEGGPMHVDGAYCWFRRAHPEFITLLAVPQLGYQRVSRTDVHDLKWYDSTVGIRLAVSLVRRLRAGRQGGN